MNTKNGSIKSKQRSFLFFAAVMAWLNFPILSGAQVLTLANPHWNITLSDFGYSDFMLDNTPGFEGREYLSGEWAAAVGYQAAGRPVTSPQWLEAHFIFPDWNTFSPFHVVTPLAQTGLNADNLPIAQSVIVNDHLQITLRYEMLDTVVGTPMGARRASATNAAAFISSDRYVLKQTCIIKNVSTGAINNLQLFQLLHGLVSQRAVYDNRLYPGPLGEFRYDITQVGVDTAAVGGTSSMAGLEDWIAFHANVAPSAYEVGHYGIEGNGVDDHAIGKPSDGVHLSIEDNWQHPPYSTRQGTDEFAPPQRWISGAQRWDLGNLALGQSASLDILLTLRTGTKVTVGPGSSGGCNGGSSVPGGLAYEFEDVSNAGSCFADYSQADDAEIAVHVAQGEFEPFTFLTAGAPHQLWEVDFTGSYSGGINLTFGYDAAILPAGFNENSLCIYQFKNSSWQKLLSHVNPALHTINVNVATLGVFVLGLDAGTLVTFTINAAASPANSGAISGAGTYAEGSSATLVATANPGYVFHAWMESGVEISLSPSFSFIVSADRSLAAQFVPVGSGVRIATGALPSYGGSTFGDGEYAAGATATVVATPNAGFKFSKWLENGVTASQSSSYSFTVSGTRTLQAKFKPVFTIAVGAEPPEGGEIEVDAAYELGELAKVKAVPNQGYSFVHWTQNGVVVNDDEIYQFNVTGHRELVGHFAPGNRIDVLAEPANGGSVTGGGVYAAGIPVTVEATSNPGYVFVDWTEFGAPASATATYTFPSSVRRTLVANFIAQPAIRIDRTSQGVTISWPAAATGWVLQESADMIPGNWVDSTRPVVIAGDRKQVTVFAPSGKAFFKLNYPAP